MNYVIGFDIGGTNIVGGILNEKLELLQQKKISTEADKGLEHVINSLTQLVDRLLQSVDAGREELLAVGIGTPGLVDPVKGVVIFAGNLGWHHVPLAEKLQALLQVPVTIDNDVRMYGYGEKLKGAGQGAECMLAATLGTGIAATVIDKDAIFYGSGFMAGEMGHIPMPGESTTCVCGLTGCLETVASATGIERQVQEALDAGETSLLSELRQEHGRITAAMVSQAYDQGDALAVRVLTHTAHVLARGLSCVIPMISPDVIVLGGGVSLAGDRLFAPMREELSRLVYRGYLERLTIVPGQLIDTGGVIGSAALAYHKRNI
ncbi:ROK family protein [Paenibacillus silviterrae]|uniref:ROK family protein n=1 Tax=Paenibacillus silviterrae TaxID=3242194 RepID=UPI0025434E4B|nr:ROK family protein [Paenibacillus chinjuensis]